MGSAQCTKPDIQQRVDIPDHPGHSLSISQFKCTWTKPLEVTGVQSKGGLDSGSGDIHGDKGTSHGFYIDTMANGDIAFVHWSGTDDMKAGTSQGKWNYTGGTGKFKALKGGGTYRASMRRTVVSALMSKASTLCLTLLQRDVQGTWRCLLPADRDRLWAVPPAEVWGQGHRCLFWRPEPKPGAIPRETASRAIENVQVDPCPNGVGYGQRDRCCNSNATAEDCSLTLLPTLLRLKPRHSRRSANFWTTCNHTAVMFFTALSLR